MILGVHQELIVNLFLLGLILKDFVKQFVNLGKLRLVSYIVVGVKHFFEYLDLTVEQGFETWVLIDVLI